MIGVVDYGSGNVFSLMSALKTLSHDAMLVTNVAEIRNVSKIILPGVGAFPSAMEKLYAKDLVEVVKETIEDRYALGICVGMQIMFSVGEEFGTTKGLGVIPGKVIKLSINESDPPKRKLPHIGWAPVNFATKLGQTNSIASGIDASDEFYFAHSFHATPDNLNDVMMTANYGHQFTAAIARGNIFGAQFHPEKSGKAGLRFLDNFCSLC